MSIYILQYFLSYVQLFNFLQNYLLGHLEFEFGVWLRLIFIYHPWKFQPNPFLVWIFPPKACLNLLLFSFKVGQHFTTPGPGFFPQQMGHIPAEEIGSVQHYQSCIFLWNIFLDSPLEQNYSKVWYIINFHFFLEISSLLRALQLFLKLWFQTSCLQINVRVKLRAWQSECVVQRTVGLKCEDQIYLDITRTRLTSRF